MTRVSGGRSRNVGLLNESKRAVVDIVSGIGECGGQCGINGAPERGRVFNCWTCVESKTGLQSRSRWGFEL
jgi:hypothetical protein